MKSAFARAAPLAAWALMSACWGQGGKVPMAAAAQTSPDLRISGLQAQVNKLSAENSALRATLANVPKGNPVDSRLADAERRIRELTLENNKLNSSLASANDALKQRDDDLAMSQARGKTLQDEVQAAQARLDETSGKVTAVETEVTDLKRRLAATDRGKDTVKRIIEERQRTIDDQALTIARMRQDLREAGPPVWPWGAIALAAALGVGGGLSRWLWPKPALVSVRQPLSVDVRLGDWAHQAAMTNPSPARRFSVRAEWIPLSSSIRPAREPFVREVRDALQGAAP